MSRPPPRVSQHSRIKPRQGRIYGLRIPHGEPAPEPRSPSRRVHCKWLLKPYILPCRALYRWLTRGGGITGGAPQRHCRRALPHGITSWHAPKSKRLAVGKANLQPQPRPSTQNPARPGAGRFRTPHRLHRLRRQRRPGVLPQTLAPRRAEPAPAWLPLSR